VKLSREEFLKGCTNPVGMQELLEQAEKVFKTWQPSWSSFLSAPLREEALRRLSPLNNLYWHSDGGHPGAERQRLQCIRYEDEISITETSAPIEGLLIEGNFLFDRASAKDFRKSLEIIGVPQGAIGDIWTKGDRGAQALCTPEAAKVLNGSIGKVRDVQIHCEAVNKKELQIPTPRLCKMFSTVEASTRLDAIASAGFGLSRAKIITQIKEGRLRLNWLPVKQACKELAVGDRLQLEQRGSIEIISLEMTKRQRWKVQLLRR
tara:strand:- start:998 stop:1786 length:789 start_codon:yes stop_codon:yes gene_type:complete